MLSTMAPFCIVLFCNISVFFLLVVLVRLSIPVQLIDWKDSSPKMTYDVLMGTLNPTHSLTHSRYHGIMRVVQFIRRITLCTRMKRNFSLAIAVIVFISHSYAYETGILNRVFIVIIVCQHADACTARYCYDKSVCLSVCLSHAGIVSKRMHISSNSFRYLIGA